MKSTLGVIFYSLKYTNNETVRFYLNKKNTLVKLDNFNLINTDEDYRSDIFESAKKVTLRSFKIRYTKFSKKSFEDIKVIETGSSFITEEDFNKGKFIY